MTHRDKYTPKLNSLKKDSSPKNRLQNLELRLPRGNKMSKPGIPTLDPTLVNHYHSILDPPKAATQPALPAKSDKNIKVRKKTKGKAKPKRIIQTDLDRYSANYLNQYFDGKGTPVLEMASFWGDQLQRVDLFDKPTLFVVGGTKKCHLPLEHSAIPHSGFELLRSEKGTPVLRFNKAMSAVVHLDDRQHTLNTLIEEGIARPEPDQST